MSHIIDLLIGITKMLVNSVSFFGKAAQWVYGALVLAGGFLAEMPAFVAGFLGLGLFTCAACVILKII